MRQQTGRWHRQQNKFGKQWEQTEVTTRLVVSYFNWMWEHSRLGDTAALAGRFILPNLELEKLCCFSHTSLAHDPNRLCPAQALTTARSCPCSNSCVKRVGLTKEELNLANLPFSS